MISLRFHHLFTPDNYNYEPTDLCVGAPCFKIYQREAFCVRSSSGKKIPVHMIHKFRFSSELTLGHTIKEGNMEEERMKDWLYNK